MLTIWLVIIYIGDYSKGDYNIQIKIKTLIQPSLALYVHVCICIKHHPPCSRPRE